MIVFYDTNIIKSKESNEIMQRQISLSGDFAVVCQFFLPEPHVPVIRVYHHGQQFLAQKCSGQ